MAETTTLTIREFLSARIAEDESVAHEHGSDKWRFNPGSTFLQRYTPARVLAECEAKRQLVDVLIQDADRLEAEFGDGGCAEREAILGLRLLALPYVDHPDYREEWLP